MQAVLLALVLFGPKALPGLAPWPRPLAQAATFAGLILAGAGGVLLLVSALRLGRNLTPLPHPREGSSLVQTGPYRLVRHPIYAGVLAVAFGWALLVHGGLTLGFAVLLLVLLELKSRKEERWLCARYPGYESYRQRVARFIPYLH